MIFLSSSSERLRNLEEEADVVDAEVRRGNIEAVAAVAAVVERNDLREF